MNAIVLVSVLSVANSALFGSSRTLAALAEQKQAPKLLRYVDRRGRPLVTVGIGSACGLLAYVGVNKAGTGVFTWLLALSGLSSIFTWTTICLCHIRFRRAWAFQGNSLQNLAYVSPVGIVGSYIGVISLLLILVAQFWVAIDPIGSNYSNSSRVYNFFAAYLAVPIVIIFYVAFKFSFKTEWVTISKMDLKSGKAEVKKEHLNLRANSRSWPFWKKVYYTLC